MSNNYFSIMAYVYRHIRLDKNQPFYIGIGKDESYKRAYDKTRRNNFWRNVVSKSDYEVEILMDSMTWEQACEKEKEFISIYGRKDLGTGCLVNLTEGGEGATGISQDARKVRSQKMIGKKNALGYKRSEESKRIIGEKIRNYHFEKALDAEFENAKRLGFAD